MSPMLDIQRRHAQVFRLRLGETQNGRPVKLTEAIKVTSPSEEIVRAFTAAYGGAISEFKGEGSNDRYGALLPITELPIMVLPGNSFDQWWESWKKSVCDRRCDGEVETLSGQPCSCPADIDVRMKTKGACRPMTRINVLCPDVAVVGAGSLVSHGLIAAQTLPQSIAVAEAALSRGIMVPGMLRVVEHRGRNHYVIPQIEIVGVSLRMLTTGEVPDALGSGSPPALPTSPVPALEAGGDKGEPAVPVDEVAPNPTDEPEPARPAPSAQPPLPGEEDTSGRPFTEENETLVDNAFSRQFSGACRTAGLTDAEKRNVIGLATDGRTFTTKGVLKTEVAKLRSEFKKFTEAKAATQQEESA